MGKNQDFLTRILFFLLLAFFCTAIPQADVPLRLKLIPWNSPDSPMYREPVQDYGRTSNKYDHPNSTISLNEIQFPMQDQQNYRYAVNVKIGSGGQQFKLLVDTGSGFIWAKCNEGLSNSLLSSHTYQKLPCDHKLCAKKLCKCIKKQCVCTIKYGSTGYKYELKQAIDRFHFPGSEASIVFGCTKTKPLHLSGILALDRSPVSLVSQLRDKTGGRFSYCLHNGDSYLTLGKDISNSGKKVKTTPFIHTEYSAYFLNLTDISIGGHRLGLSPTLFALKNGGVFMDTGVQYTILPKRAYDKANQAFQNHFKGKLKKINRIYWNLEPCYKLTPGFDDFPAMTFHFQRADLEAEYTHIADRELGVACTAVVPGKQTVIGALQQLNTRFMFDNRKNVLKFYKDDCAAN